MSGPVKHVACATVVHWINLPGGGVVFWCPSCRCDLDPHDGDRIYVDAVSHGYYLYDLDTRTTRPIER